MGKAKAERRLKDNEAQAVARTLRVSPQKLNLVAAAHPRQEGCDRALAELEFSRKRIAGAVKKTLEVCDRQRREQPRSRRRRRWS